MQPEPRQTTAPARPDRPDRPGPLPDEELVHRVRAGDRAAFEVLMRRHNPRVYHAIRGILRDGPEVEDAMQQTYLLAYTHLAEFEGASSFTTWLTRIAIHEALGRVRRSDRLVLVRDGELAGDEVAAPGTGPEERAATAEAARCLERCIDDLPAIYRSVLILRDVDQLTTAEAAEALAITEQTVRIRLHRARRALRRAVSHRLTRGSGEAFPFHAPRCDRVVAGVLAALDGA